MISPYPVIDFKEDKECHSLEWRECGDVVGSDLKTRGGKKQMIRNRKKMSLFNSHLLSPKRRENCNDDYD